MIALSTESKSPSQSPAIVKDTLALPKAPSVAPVQQQCQQRSLKSADAAKELFLRSQYLDPAMQFLLTQQLSLCTERKQQQQQPPMTSAPRMPQQLGAQTFFHRQQQQQQQPPKLQMQLRQQQLMHSLVYGDGSQQIPTTFSVGEAMNATNASSNCSNYSRNNTDNSSSKLNLWRQIQAQKQQEAQMMQLRQLMALNLHRQQNRNESSAKNFRASAA